MKKRFPNAPPPFYFKGGGPPVPTSLLLSYQAAVTDPVGGGGAFAPKPPPPADSKIIDSLAPHVGNITPPPVAKSWICPMVATMGHFPEKGKRCQYSPHSHSSELSPQSSFPSHWTVAVKHLLLAHVFCPKGQEGMPDTTPKIGQDGTVSLTSLN